MKLTLAVLLLLGNTVLVIAAESGDISTPMRWLSIVATESSVNNAFASATKLQRGGGKLLLVETDDCHNLRKGLYVIVAGIHDIRASAESAIAEWRKKGVDDAYLRSCEVVVPSRLSIGIPLLDPSLTRCRIETINWGMEDVVSRVTALDNRWVALIVPRYKANPDDIREGLRIGVRLYNLDQDRSLDLSSDCIDPEFVLNATHVALTCIDETAGIHMLHRTQLNALANGRIVAKESRCAKPTFKQDHWVCQKESVDAKGILELKPITLHQN